MRTMSRTLTTRAVRLNPLYVAAVPRPHLAASLAFGVPLIDRTGTLLCESRFATISPLEDSLLQPARAGEPPPLSNIMSARAHELWAEAKSAGMDIEVLWSGGIDSTAALSALLRSAPSDEHIRSLVVKLAPRAVHENRVYYESILEKLPCKKQWITHGQVADAVSDAHLTVTGEGGDQLFGSSLLQQAYDGEASTRPFSLHTPWQEAMATHLERKLGSFASQPGSPLGGFTFGELEGYLAPQLARCPFPIETAFDLFWWMNFTMKHQHVALRLWTRRRALTSTVVASSIRHFFMARAFEEWALSPSNHARKMGDPRDWPP